MFRDFLGRPLRVGAVVAQRLVENRTLGAFQKHMGLVGVVRKLGSKYVHVEFPHDPGRYYQIHPSVLVMVSRVGDVWFARVPEGLRSDIDERAIPISYETYDGDEINPDYDPTLVLDEPYDPRQTRRQIREKTDQLLEDLKAAFELLYCVGHDKRSSDEVRLNVRHQELVEAQEMASKIRALAERLINELTDMRNEEAN